MTTLVTGASGFVGSAIVRRLLQAGHTVRVLLREHSPLENIKDLPVEMVRGDLTDIASLQHAVAGCSVLFHVAADYRLWVRHPKAMYQANVDGTRQLMTAAAEAGISRIVYTSSVATLGLHADGTPADENTPSTLDDMIGHYKRSKFMAEEIVRKLVSEQQLPAIIVNPAGPIGPRDIKPTPTGQMVLDTMRGRMPGYIDTGLNIVHVDDVAKGHLLAFEHGNPGERYILGGENLPLKDILTRVATLAGRKPPRIRMPYYGVLPLAWLSEVMASMTGAAQPLIAVDGVRMTRKRMYFSSEKARCELGYTARPAQAALADAVTWF
ncbi:MAG: NAD-dependent epimerase/dehydratase family protein, partial [Mariprofundus sp.]|nr:NAD-dependent epimerase/dehydratase family protein [Mariprofundus sp.]